MSVFISHSSKDSAVAVQLCDFLEERQIKCFIAPRDIRSGQEYAAEIIDGLDCSEAVVLLMSNAANDSPHVLREVEHAVSKKIPILTYKLEEVKLSKSMEYFLMTHQWVDVGNQGDFSEVLRFLATLGQEGDGAEAAADVNGGQTGNPAASGQPDRMRDRESTKGGYRFWWAWAAGAALAVLLAFAIFRWTAPPSSGSDPTAAEDPGIKPGDTVVLGSYNQEPIEWRVLRLEEKDGEQLAVLVSRYILTMKAFDAAESGRYNQDENGDYLFRDSPADTDLALQAYVRGSSDWSSSNIRTWLNARTEVVVYADQAPTAAAMSELKNGYQNEPGFLYYFTDEERESLVEREIHTSGNALAGDGDVVTYDCVFLLSAEELNWFDEAGVSKLAEPTQAALEQDASRWYEVYLTEFGVKEYCWWLRDPASDRSSVGYLVGNGYNMENDQIGQNLAEANVGLEGYGIRPAVTVRVSGIINKQDKGEKGL